MRTHGRWTIRLGGGASLFIVAGLSAAATGATQTAAPNADDRAGCEALQQIRTGHDNGAEPGSSFAYNNRQAEIDFGYRAVRHVICISDCK